MQLEELATKERDLVARLVGRGRLSRSVLARFVEARGAAPSAPTEQLLRELGVDATRELEAAAGAKGRAPAEAAGARRVVGRYVLGAAVGQGGMGTVFRAYDPVLHRQVAIKVVNAAREGSPEAAARFEREAQTVAGIQHAGIVALHDFGEHDGRLFFVMDFVEGLPLDLWLAGRPRSEAEIAGVVRGVAVALVHVHALGVAHRDVKPENVLVDQDGRARLADFGLVHREDESGLTASGQILGTPPYMAPEQALAPETVGPASDVYGLGGLIYHALAGKPPNPMVGSIVTLLRWFREGSVAPLGDAERVSPELAALALRCLEHEPARRPASAREVVAALDAVLARAAPPAAPGQSAGALRGVLLGVLAALGVVALAGALLLVLARR